MQTRISRRAFVSFHPSVDCWNKQNRLGISWKLLCQTIQSDNPKWTLCSNKRLWQRLEHNMSFSRNDLMHSKSLRLRRSWFGTGNSRIARIWCIDSKATSRQFSGMPVRKRTTIAKKFRNWFFQLSVKTVSHDKNSNLTDLKCAVAGEENCVSTLFGAKTFKPPDAAPPAVPWWATTSVAGNLVCLPWSVSLEMKYRSYLMFI